MQQVDLPLLEFREDGVYLDGRRLDYIMTFDLHSDADKSSNISELRVTGLRVDAAGDIVLDDFGDAQQYDIDTYVIVNGLGSMDNGYTF